MGEYQAKYELSLEELEVLIPALMEAELIYDRNPQYRYTKAPKLRTLIEKICKDLPPFQVYEDEETGKVPRAWFRKK